MQKHFSFHFLGLHWVFYHSVLPASRGRKRRTVSISLRPSTWRLWPRFHLRRRLVDLPVLTVNKRLVQRLNEECANG